MGEDSIRSQPMNFSTMLRHMTVRAATGVDIILIGKNIAEDWLLQAGMQ